MVLNPQVGRTKVAVGSSYEPAPAELLQYEKWPATLGGWQAGRLAGACALFIIFLPRERTLVYRLQYEGVGRATFYLDLETCHLDDTTVGL